MKTDGSPLSICISFLQGRVYRGGQGQLVRGVAFFTLVICVFIASCRFYSFLAPHLGDLIALGLCVCMNAVAAWSSFCLIQHQPIADFLIEVQIESLKVSWSNWLDLRQTTGVVLAVMAAFSLYLFACDISWQFLLRAISVLNI